MGAGPSSLLEQSSPSMTGRPVIAATPLPSDALSSLQSITSINDITFLPDSAGYKETNVCWNFDAIGSPSVIFTPRSEDELKSILGWYQSFPSLWSLHGLSIHAGGHSHYSLKHHSVVIHLKHFNKKELNKETNVGTFGAGLKLGDLDAFTQSFGLATTAGTNPDTGISGLTLGGGFGYLARQYGLTIDNVVGFRVMLLDGRVVDATKGGEYDDLYWALKGGGGNFGVVLEYRYQLYPRGDVLQGVCVFLTRQKSFFSVGAEEIIRQYRDHFLKAPRELGLMVAFPCGGPLVFPFSYTGNDLMEGKKLMDEVTKIGSPMIKKVFQSKYAVEKNSLQWSALDHQKHGNWYEAGIIIKELSDDVINIILKYTVKPNIPNGDSQVILAQLGGKIDEVKENETPFLGRNAPFWLMVLGKWGNCKSTVDYLSERNKVKHWVKNIVTELKPYSKAGSYQTLGEAEVSEPKKDNNNNNNNNNNEEKKQTESSIPSSSTTNDIESAPEWYGINYARLVEIKRKYDPKNIFRHNKNIDPNAKI